MKPHFEIIVICKVTFLLPLVWWSRSGEGAILKYAQKPESYHSYIAIITLTFPIITSPPPSERTKCLTQVYRLLLLHSDCEQTVNNLLFSLFQCAGRASTNRGKHSSPKWINTNVFTDVSYFMTKTSKFSFHFSVQKNKQQNSSVFSAEKTVNMSPCGTKLCLLDFRPFCLI